MYAKCRTSGYERGSMNTFEPIETQNLSERVADVIRSAIISGQLAPGAPIRDRQVAEELGVSRTPVRDALYRLHSEGLAEIKGRTGWAVTDFTAQDVHELFQLRMLLEPQGLYALERSPDPEKIAVIGSSFDGFQHPIPPERHLEYFTVDDDFHRYIVLCSGNRRLISIYNNLKDHINRGRYILSGSSASRLEDTLDEHTEIVNAVLAGDFARARESLIEHLRTGEELMIQRVRDRDGG